eukprot:TRINITY_DN17786_c0_g1_i1.p1 TRINITY_DN17786_c0_g1~~TRINITY_DN17786_c0_g1_i1.p1  ORF type:complete len:197 (-),score=9.65 TRINITY_DN17786_c0_g1_i1:103-693(-)
MLYYTCKLLMCLGWLIGGYSSFKTLRNPASKAKWESANKKRLMFWASFSFLYIYDQTLEVLISWFPFYWEAKFVILLFLLFNSNGPKWIFNMLIDPLFVILPKTFIYTFICKVGRIAIRFVYHFVDVVDDNLFNFIIQNSSADELNQMEKSYRMRLDLLEELNPEIIVHEHKEVSANPDIIEPSDEEGYSMLEEEY